jgi:glycerol-3-phosphate dehydrogenase
VIAGERRFDTVVVGGGVYGVLLALEGAARGHKLLLVEREDFGGGASFNHLRTIHGGLRYLQRLDLRRAMLSNVQRRWWLQHFPDLVGPIRCLMPLYGEGLRRPAAFRAAFALARALDMHRDAAGRPGRFELLPPAAVHELLPDCRTEGLRGGAVWHDAFMPHPHRLMAELVHWAERAGAAVQNHTSFTAAERHDDGLWHMSLRNGRTGATAEVEAKWIVNAAGAATDDVIARMADRAVAPVLVPTLGWNLLIDRPAPANCSVAVARPGGTGSTWFLHPYHGRTLAGTGHAGIVAGAGMPEAVADIEVQAMLDELNAALPGSRFSRGQVRHVFHGIIPGVRPGSADLLKRHEIVDHGPRDGLPGLWTVLGVKFTEAPAVARQFWDRRLGPRAGALPGRPEPQRVPGIEEARGLSDEALRAALLQLAGREWQADAADLVWRRTDLWMDERQASRVAKLVAPAVAAKV